jgi:Holliday junction resolvase
VRRRPKVDNNQRAIQAALEAAGATVVSLAACGDGVPDLLVGWGGVNLLLEVKCPRKEGGRGLKLTPAQVNFREQWRGQSAVVESVDQALDLMRSIH